MSAGALNAGLMAVTLLGVAVGTCTAVRPAAVASVEHPAPAALSATPEKRVLVDTLVGAFVARDPFRIGRRPASVAYNPVRDAQPVAPAPPKPALALTGVVWDARGDPSAVLEGLPGIAGPRVVREGDRLGSLEVRRIGRDRVLVVGMDTTWTLVVREPWH